MLRASDPPSTDVVGWAWQEWARPRRGTAPVRRHTRRRAALWACGAFATTAALVLLAGFLAFVGALDRHERTPSDRVDGIVALTGGAQRIGDAIDLLAGGYGRRLLITGVNERTSRDEIARLNPTQRALIACCVDLDYRARNTIGNAISSGPCRAMRLSLPRAVERAQRSLTPNVSPSRRKAFRARRGQAGAVRLSPARS